MTATLAARPPQTPMPERLTTSTAPPVALERRHWLAALAMLVVLFAPYQTLVQTVTTDDADSASMSANRSEYDGALTQYAELTTTPTTARSSSELCPTVSGSTRASSPASSLRGR